MKTPHIHPTMGLEGEVDKHKPPQRQSSFSTPANKKTAIDRSAPSKKGVSRERSIEPLPPGSHGKVKMLPPKFKKLPKVPAKGDFPLQSERGRPQSMKSHIGSGIGRDSPIGVAPRSRSSSSSRGSSTKRSPSPGRGHSGRGIPSRSVPVRGGPIRGGPVRGGPVRGGPVRGGPVRGGGLSTGRGSGGLGRDGVPSRGVPSRGVPSRGGPVRVVPSRGGPSRSVPARGVPTRTIPGRGIPSRGAPVRAVGPGRTSFGKGPIKHGSDPQMNGVVDRRNGDMMKRQYNSFRRAPVPSGRGSMKDDTSRPFSDPRLNVTGARKGPTPILFQAIPQTPEETPKKRFPKAKMKLREGEEQRFHVATNSNTACSRNNPSSFPMPYIPQFSFSRDEGSQAGSTPARSKRSIRVLICSANLGNARPDYDSLNAWIPPDGCVEIDLEDLAATVQAQIRPLMEGPTSPHPPTIQEEKNTNDLFDEKFDPAEEEKFQNFFPKSTNDSNRDQDLALFDMFPKCDNPIPSQSEFPLTTSGENDERLEEKMQPLSSEGTDKAVSNSETERFDIVLPALHQSTSWDVPATDSDRQPAAKAFISDKISDFASQPSESDRLVTNPSDATFHVGDSCGNGDLAVETDNASPKMDTIDSNTLDADNTSWNCDTAFDQSTPIDNVASTFESTFQDESLVMNGDVPKDLSNPNQESPRTDSKVDSTFHAEFSICNGDVALNNVLNQSPPTDKLDDTFYAELNDKVPKVQNNLENMLNQCLTTDSMDEAFDAIFDDEASKDTADFVLDNLLGESPSANKVDEALDAITNDDVAKGTDDIILDDLLDDSPSTNEKLNDVICNDDGPSNNDDAGNMQNLATDVVSHVSPGNPTLMDADEADASEPSSSFNGQNSHIIDELLSEQQEIFASGSFISDKGRVGLGSKSSQELGDLLGGSQGIFSLLSESSIRNPSEPSKQSTSKEKRIGTHGEGRHKSKSGSDELHAPIAGPSGHIKLDNQRLGTSSSEDDMSSHDSGIEKSFHDASQKFCQTDGDMKAVHESKGMPLVDSLSSPEIFNVLDNLSGGIAAVQPGGKKTKSTTRLKGDNGSTLDNLARSAGKPIVSEEEDNPEGNLQDEIDDKHQRPNNNLDECTPQEFCEIHEPGGNTVGSYLASNSSEKIVNQFIDEESTIFEILDDESTAVGTRSGPTDDVGTLEDGTHNCESRKESSVYQEQRTEDALSNRMVEAPGNVNTDALSSADKLDVALHTTVSSEKKNCEVYHKRGALSDEVAAEDVTGHQLTRFANEKPETVPNGVSKFISSKQVSFGESTLMSCNDNETVASKEALTSKSEKSEAKFSHVSRFLSAKHGSFGDASDKAVDGTGEEASEKSIGERRDECSEIPPVDTVENNEEELTTKDLHDIAVNGHDRQSKGQGDDYETFCAGQGSDNSNLNEEYERFLATQTSKPENFTVKAETDDYESFLFFNQAGGDDYEAYLAKQASPDDGFRSSVKAEDSPDPFVISSELEDVMHSSFTTAASITSSFSKQSTLKQPVAKPPPIKETFGKSNYTKKTISKPLSDFVKHEPQQPKPDELIQQPKPDESTEQPNFEVSTWDSLTQISKESSQLQPTRKEHFEIIVIGMQEATFKSEEEGKHVDDDGGSNCSDEDSLSSGEEADPTIANANEAISLVTGEKIEECIAQIQAEDDIDDGSLSCNSDNKSLSSTEDEVEIVQPLTSDSGGSTAHLIPESTDTSNSNTTSKPTNGSKRTRTGKVMGATLKAGKAALKAGKKVRKATLKVGTATIKAGKAAKTLTIAKDHTKRGAPTAQQTLTPLMDGGIEEFTDTEMLHYMVDEQLPSYKRALSYQLGEMRLMVYYNASAIDLDVLSVKTHATGKHGLANKGGIVAEVAVNKSTRLSFLTAHLEAHEGERKYEKRCSSFRSIYHRTTSAVTPFRYDASLSSHFSFVLGDLNFRSRLPLADPGSAEHIKKCHELAAKKNWRELNKHDELSQALRLKDCLVGFTTPYCNFNPTFKVSRKDGYEYNVKRSPSYTDRILYKTGDQLEPHLKLLSYEPISNFTSSDHKPIRGAFDIELNEEIKIKNTWDNSEQRLHIFASSIVCLINRREYKRIHKSSDSKTDPPSTFVAFVSTPEEAVKADVSKRASTWKSFGLGGSRKKSKSKQSSKETGEPGKKTASAMTKIGWPGTTIMPNTYEATWSEGVHLEVRTHYEDGASIDLSGALLHLTVFDYKGGESKVLGTFPLNLARLIILSRESRQADDDTIEVGAEIPFTPGWSFNAHTSTPSRAIQLAANQNLCHEAVRQASKFLNDGRKSPIADERSKPSLASLNKYDSKTRLSVVPSKSIRDIIRQASNDSSDSSQGSMGSKLNQLKMVSLNLDEPLTESGREVGRITCSIDAWWMGENFESILEESSHVGSERALLLQD